MNNAEYKPKKATDNTIYAIQTCLFELQDIKYRDFLCKLIPTANPKSVIGVRIPELRKLAKGMAGISNAAEFLHTLPHVYHEENTLHGLLIGEIADYNELIAALDVFLPFVGNWAVCDTIRPKAFKKHPPQLPDKIKEWLKSDHTYTIRFGVEMLMSHYLDEHFSPEYPALVEAIISEEYYVSMMNAWYFATALTKRYHEVLPYIEQHRLDDRTHNRTIQKAIESYRISAEQKAYLRTLRI